MDNKQLNVSVRTYRCLANQYEPDDWEKVTIDDIRKLIRTKLITPKGIHIYHEGYPNYRSKGFGRKSYAELIKAVGLDDFVKLGEVEKKMEFSTFSACEILGIDYTALNEWIRNGFIELDTTANGRGTRSRISFENLVTIRAFQIMVKAGITRKLARDLIKRAQS